MLRNVRSNVTFALNEHTYVVLSVACVCFLRMINYALISMFEDVVTCEVCPRATWRFVTFISFSSRG